MPIDGYNIKTSTTCVFWKKKKYLTFVHRLSFHGQKLSERSSLRSRNYSPIIDLTPSFGSRLQLSGMRSTVSLLFFSQFGICTKYNPSMSTVGLFSLSRSVRSPHPLGPGAHPRQYTTGMDGRFLSFIIGQTVD